MNSEKIDTRLLWLWFIIMNKKVRKNEIVRDEDLLEVFFDNGSDVEDESESESSDSESTSLHENTASISHLSKTVPVIESSNTIASTSGTSNTPSNIVPTSVIEFLNEVSVNL